MQLSKKWTSSSLISAKAIATSVTVMTMLSVLSMAATTVQAAGLSDLFGNNSAAKTQFLPVNEAFGVLTSTKVTTKGTRLSITFDITPGHYVYQNKLALSFPKGINATSFSFNQKPVTIDDPTFGRVPIFKQRSVVATTTLSTANGKGAKNVPITIGWQGCATAGLCYPPEKVKTKINISATR